MKLKRILFSLLTVISVVLGITVKAETTAPEHITVDAKDMPMIYGSYYLSNSTIKFTYKVNTDGVVVYCTEIHDDMVKNGTETYTLSKELDSRFAYIIQNGYPNKYIFGNDNKDYFTTGLAIWYLIAPNDNIFTNFNLDKGTYRGSYSDIVTEMAKLVKGANNYKYVDPSIKLETSSNNLTLSSDGKYYVSSNIKAVTTGTINGNYSVSTSGAPEGTIITDINGNEKNSFAVSEEFIVKVPVSKLSTTKLNFKINASATGVINKAYEYKPSISSHQNLAILYPENKNINASLDLNLDIVTEVQITKIDATNSEELEGAHLVVKDSTGKVIDEWTSTKEAHIIKGIKPGKYTLTETIAPEGYKLSTETITFEVKADGSVTKVEMKNYPNDVVVEITKIDATTSEELEGAHLVVKDSNGKVVDEWVSTKEAHIIKDIKPGKYTLTETIAPEGYILSTETITFEVKNDGSVTKVVMKNYPEDKPVPIVISKQDITTKEELPGAHLEIKDEEGNVVVAWISGEEPFVIEEGLEPGKYTLTETIAPEGYELSTEVIEFIVKEDGIVDGDIIMYNSPEVVEVPSTSSFKTITASLIGIMIISLGSLIIYRNYKKNEE